MAGKVMHVIAGLVTFAFVFGACVVSAIDIVRIKRWDKLTLVMTGALFASSVWVILNVVRGVMK